MDKTANIGTSSPCEAQFAEAVTLHQAGSLPQAENLYREILAQDPSHAGSLHNLGLIAFQCGQIDTAAELMSQALAARPNWAEAYNNLGNIFKTQGKAEQAINAYLQVLTLQPGNQDAQSSLAAMLAEQDHAMPPPLQAIPSRTPYQTCPLCESTEIPAIITADCTQHPLYQPLLPAHLAWHRCQACQHVFAEGYFTDEAAEVVFSNTHPQRTVGYDAEEQRQVSAHIVERVARYTPPEGIWLDIGIGNASLLFTAEEWGYQPEGIASYPENVHSLLQLGYQAHATPLEALQHNGHYRVISMINVLERRPFPRQDLAVAHRLLGPGGALLLAMPNIGSMIWRLLDADANNPYWGDLEHYHHFSRQRLYALLVEYGFKPVDFNISQHCRIGMEIIAVKQ